MFRADPFNQFDGLGSGTAEVLQGGTVNKHYRLWNRNPRTVKESELAGNTLTGPRGNAGPSY
jgi:hypothetical protein